MERTVLVEGLPADVTVDEVVEFAENVGGLERVVVEHEGDDRSASAKGWITFERDRNAARAIRTLNGRLLAGHRVAAHWASEGFLHHS